MWGIRNRVKEHFKLYTMSNERYPGFPYIAQYKWPPVFCVWKSVLCFSDKVFCVCGMMVTDDDSSSLCLVLHVMRYWSCECSIFPLTFIETLMGSKGSHWFMFVISRDGECNLDTSTAGVGVSSGALLVAMMRVSDWQFVRQPLHRLPLRIWVIKGISNWKMQTRLSILGNVNDGLLHRSAYTRISRFSLVAKI